MKESKTIYYLLIPYLISFVLLVVKYLNRHSDLLNLLKDSELEMSKMSLWILIVTVSLIFSLVVCLVYYLIIKKLIFLLFSMKIEKEELFSTILLSETLTQVVALWLLGIIPEETIRLIIPFLGTFLFFVLLHKNNSIRVVLGISGIRFGLYLVNWLAVITEML